MKMRLFAAIAALLIAGAASAQEKDPVMLEKAQKSIEAMSQYVKMDDATKQKTLDIMYTRVVAHSVLNKQKKSMPAEEWKTENSKIYRTWVDDMRKALPAADQRKGFDTWRNLPKDKK